MKSMIELELHYPTQGSREFWFNLWKNAEEMENWPEWKNRRKTLEPFDYHEYMTRLNILERDAKAEMEHKLREVEENFKAELAKYRKEKRRVKKKLKSPG